MSNTHRIGYGIIIVLMTGLGVVRAQNYPVQSSIQVTPPYSLFLQDYVSESNRLSLLVLLKDMNRGEYKVRFKFSIEGNGLSISTDPRYLPPPTFLQGGVPLSLSGPELADYLSPFNLVFSGITRQEFQRTGRLPEGPYKICFQVLDYNIGIPVSNQSCNTAWLMLNDPPLINLPANNIKVRPVSPQNLVFQWTPRHTASPTASFSTEYYFRMVEVWPVNRNPFDALNVGIPFYETITSNTSILYSLSDPPLVPGRVYAFRVQVRQKEGVIVRDLFKNGGYSEVFTFTYGDECKEPLNLRATTPDAGRIKVNWEGLPAHTGYVLQYKESGTDMEWRQEQSFVPSYIITSLKPGVNYDIQVEGQCASIYSDFTTALKQKTLELTASNFECGRLPASYNLDNVAPLESLSAGDIIWSGDFEVEVKEVTGSNGTFTGTGGLSIPFINYLKVPVYFNAITINTDKRVLKGNVVVNVNAIGVK